MHVSNCRYHNLPLYPGTHFPACPGGGVLELPSPIHDAVIGDPVSGGGGGKHSLSLTPSSLSYVTLALVHSSFSTGPRLDCPIISSHKE